MAMHPVYTTDEEMDRLRVARTARKWGQLATWKELYIFQRTIGSKDQVVEIGNIARRKKNGEPITLPYMNYKKI